MDTTQAKLLLELVPKLPLIVKVALLHLIKASPPSKYVDLRTELTVAILRSFLTPSTRRSISDTQRLANRDPGIKGRIWVAKYTAPAPPEPSVRDAVTHAIESLSTRPEALKSIEWPEVVGVEAEWTGYRSSATASSKLPPITEKEMYGEMMKEVKNPTTVLYLHGGAYYLMDPATHRPTTKKLAKLTGGRCYSVRYRLAPQNPFPAALLDALHSYLTLLHPPEGAYHEAVKPEHIIFAGDSAGGNLCMALTQLLLEFKRSNTTVTWHGRQVQLPPPSGIVLSSPWLDLTHSSPSCTSNAPFDYLPQLKGLDQKPLPSCDAWPAKPPRKALFCADALLTHPLVTLVTARSWEGCPPVYMSTGWELLADENKYMVARLHADKIKVIWEEYEGMPHCFAMILWSSPMSRKCFDSMTGFIKKVIEKGPDGVDSGFTRIKARTYKEEAADPTQLAPYTEKELRKRLEDLAAVGNSAKAAGDVAAKL